MSSVVVEEATERAAALRSTLASRVVISDGAMGTMIQASDATLDDFEGHEGCNEVLNVTRPDVVRAIHHAYLAAGADCVTTNTFGANFGNLSEYGIPERIGELSQSALCRKALGPHIFDRYVEIKRKEWDEYRIQLTEWELKKYLSVL